MNRLNKKYLKIFFLTFAFTILLFIINIFTSLAIYEVLEIIRHNKSKFYGFISFHHIKKNLYLKL